MSGDAVAIVEGKSAAVGRRLSVGAWVTGIGAVLMAVPQAPPFRSKVGWVSTKVVVVAVGGGGGCFVCWGGGAWCTIGW